MPPSVASTADPVLTREEMDRIAGRPTVPNDAFWSTPTPELEDDEPR